MTETAIATREAARLAELEATIERGLHTFVDVGNALLEIRDSRLYRETHNCFDQCSISLRPGPRLSTPIIRRGGSMNRYHDDSPFTQLGAAFLIGFLVYVKPAPPQPRDPRGPRT